MYSGKLCQWLHLWNMDVLVYYYVLCSLFSLKREILLYNLCIDKGAFFCSGWLYILYLLAWISLLFFDFSVSSSPASSFLVCYYSL